MKFNARNGGQGQTRAADTGISRPIQQKAMPNCDKQQQPNQYISSFGALLDIVNNLVFVRVNTP